MLEKNIIQLIATELNIKYNQVKTVISLLEEDATVPFIARYRKEATQGLDEVAIISIRDRDIQLKELEKRRESILKSIKEQEKLTPELEKAIIQADTMAKLEDLYLPYKQKKRTRGTIAKEKGLEPLAKEIFNQDDSDIESLANKYINADKKVNSIDEAMQGARDIIAEWINEDGEIREKIRKVFIKTATISSAIVKGKEKDKKAATYRDYFDWNEPIEKMPSHRFLAIQRGIDEGILKSAIKPEEEKTLLIINQKFIKNKNRSSDKVKLAIEDGYKRLLAPSMENETRGYYKKIADIEAIKVFTNNLKELLLASPLGQKTILAIDPGLRTGCKVVCLDKHGKLLETKTIYPLQPQNKIDESAEIIKSLCKDFDIEAIAIGNGTGGREALTFCKNIGLEDIIITMVNESGASIYSASKIAREEFPDKDITVRGAASIGRRLMDPLAELVKIDPKSIGVGQYQHDVNQKELKKSLDDVVMSCVNAIGVDINTASSSLLKYVSGLSSKLAKNIISYRDKNGGFTSREDFNKVSGMGPKSFEQAAGFLRIVESKNPLDASAVHPESYHIVEKMAEDISCSLKELISNPKSLEKIKLKDYITDNTGILTLEDIYQELLKPGRDPRKEFELFNFKDNVNTISDLETGMMLPGVITNVAAFGAFVDIGVHQDGLVHISQLSDTFVKDTNDVVKVNQKVNVTVMEIDTERNRISLSMKSVISIDGKEKKKTPKPKTNKPGVEHKKKKIKNTNKQTMQSPPPVSPFADLANLIKK